MAFRVDDIIVSEKNVYLLNDGVQYIVDIEPFESKNESNDNYYGNLWNIFDKNGNVINNIFDVKDFKVRTQIVKSLTKYGNNNREAHESFFMPKANTMLGMCQLYDNAYSISALSDDKFRCEYRTDINGGNDEYSANYGFCQYPHKDELIGNIDTSIAPEILYTPNNGVQYLTEYPLNGYYSDFGNNEIELEPTIYGDSVITKYFLDYNYSVNAFADDNGGIRFSKMRTYSGIGTTGNSIYLVYKNDKIGRNNYYGLIHESNFIDFNKLNDNVTFKANFNIDTIGFTNNMVAAVSVDDNALYMANSITNPLERVRKYTELFIKEYQPNDLSFMLYLVQQTGNTIENRIIGMVYIPKNGTIESSVIYKFSSGNGFEELEDLDVVSLNHSVVIGTKTHGLISVHTPDIDNNDESSNDFNPFHLITLFNDDGEEISSDSFFNFELFYNGGNIIAAKCLQEEYGNSHYAFLSTSYDSDGKHYDIGSSWRLAFSTDTPIVDTTTVADTNTNVVSDILFDYCPVNSDGLLIGEYAFIQFDKHGLRKIHVSEIPFTEFKYYENNGTTEIVISGKYAILSSTGVVNKSVTNKTCIGVHFDLISYDNSLKSNALATLNYVGDGSVYKIEKPALKATWKDSNSYCESFTLLPLNNERDIVKESVFSTPIMRDVEQLPIDNFKFALDKSIPQSMGVTVKHIHNNTIKHDVSAALVHWNDQNGIYTTNRDYTNPETSIGGLHLQYSAIVSDIMVRGSFTASRKVSDNTWADDFEDHSIVYNTKDWQNGEYTSTIYEYPHPAYGDFVTYGSKIRIFDGAFDDSMKVKDIFMVNGNLIIKNFKIKPQTSQNNINTNDIAMKSESNIIPNYVSGGYVVSSFFSSDSTIGSLYSTEHISSTSRIDSNNKTNGKEYVYTYYNNLWHIKPTQAISVFPASTKNEVWKPFYAGKYVESIRYHNGYYYIILHDKEGYSANGYGYELIETDSLYSEKNVKKLSTGRYVTNIRFIGNYVAVEYSSFGLDGILKKEPCIVFEQGKFINRYQLSINQIEFDTLNITDSAWLTQTHNNVVFVTSNTAYPITTSSELQLIESESDVYSTIFTNVKTVNNKMLLGTALTTNNIPSLHYSINNKSFTSAITPTDITSKFSSINVLTDNIAIVCDGYLTQNAIGNGIVVCKTDFNPYNARVITIDSNGKSYFTYMEFGNYKVCAKFKLNSINYCIVKNLTTDTFYISRDFHEYGNGYECGEIFEKINTGFDNKNVECIKIISCVKDEYGDVVFTSINDDNKTMSISVLDINSTVKSVNNINIPSGEAIANVNETVLSVAGNPTNEQTVVPVNIIRSRVIESSDITEMVFTSDNRMFIYKDGFVKAEPIAVIEDSTIEQFIIPTIGFDGVLCVGISIICKNEENIEELSLHRLINDYTISSSTIGKPFKTFKCITNEHDDLVTLVCYDEDVVFVVDYSQLTNNIVDFRSTTNNYNYTNLAHTVTIEPEEGSEETPETYDITYKVKDILLSKNNYIALMSSNRTDSDISSFGIVKTNKLSYINNDIDFEFGTFVDGKISAFVTNININETYMTKLLMLGTIRNGDTVYDNMILTIDDTVSENIEQILLNDFNVIKFLRNNSKFDMDVSETTLNVTENKTSDAYAKYDNVEVLYSLNRFTPSVCHKSNLFSIRIDGLGINDSEFLTDTQKSNVIRWFKNGITEMVNATKPAHTQLFDIYFTDK